MMPSAAPPLPGLFRLSGWVAGYALRRWLPLLAVILSLLVRVGMDVLKPWPMLVLVDYVLRGAPMPAWLARLVGLLPGTATPEALTGWCVVSTVVLFLMSWAVGLANAYANISLGQRMTYDLAAQLFSRLQQLSLRFHTRRAAGDSIRRVTADCTCVSVIAKDALLPILSAGVSLLVMFGIMWRLSPALTLWALAVVPCMAAIFRLYAQPMLDRSSAQQEADAGIYSLVERTLAAMPVVQAYGREGWNNRRLREIHRDTLAATLALTDVQLRFKLLMGVTTAAGTAGILWWGAYQALAGHASVGTILVFLSYVASLYAPVESIMYTSAIIQSAAGSAARVRDVLDARRDVTDAPGAVTLGAARGQVRLEQVAFGYEAGLPVLRGISLEAEPGETIALVGPSGAGKSTLVSLLPRFFDPWEGRVCLDGRDLRTVALKSLRRHIGLVLQEPFLFPQTIAANIAYGRPKATLAEIEAAARAAGAHDFITRLPQGYHTPVGERGATLSGGERQRLSIARALLKSAPVLILDEPTSALDAQTERLLLDALEQLTAGRTTFIIAHRLSTVRRASRIVFLENGRVVETGTPRDLLARGGRYAAFHHAQFGAA
ncbi:MAG: ABC transporter ATP-binding protein [Verrucomicrobia bacterium]|nr:ABC transporter ATP-binding protein [Verrucomicrobiota bacterium]